jgi:sugar lactone lactonase YvrE
MKWFSGASAGILAAGDGSPGSSSTQLNGPIHIIVDVNEYMYISDAGNARIIRWAPNSTFGVCVAACTSTAGTAPTQLNMPHSLAFDSNGSLYVSDWENHRVQKFQILYSVGE